MKNTNKKHKEMRKEAVERLIETLDYFGGYYCDLHNEAFNTDYYIIGAHRAKEALTEYGVFDAIDTVQTYEKDNFGEVYTDLSDPEKLINMLFYIIGDEVMQEIETINEVWDDIADEETNGKIIAELKKML